MTDTNISGQGYLYGSEPKATNPFYNKDDTGGGSAPDKYVKSARIVQGESTDAVKLETVTVENGTETTANSTEWNVQGRQGEKGEQGEPGSKGDTGEPGKAATVTVGTTTTGEPGTDASVANSGTESDAVLNFTIPKGEKGDKGDPGADGAPGAKGDPGDPVSKAGLMTDVSMTNENGIYAFKQTKYDDTGTATAETEIGTVEVPTASEGIVEVKDSVVENNTKGYDFHTITETENDGTENEVGKFYIAQKQVTKFGEYPTGYGGGWLCTTIDQNGNEVTNLGQKFGIKGLPRVSITLPDYEEGKNYFLKIYDKNSAFGGCLIPLPTFSDKTKYVKGLILAVVPNYIEELPYAVETIDTPCILVFYVSDNYIVKCSGYPLHSGILAHYSADLDVSGNTNFSIEVL